MELLESLCQALSGCLSGEGQPQPLDWKPASQRWARPPTLSALTAPGDSMSPAAGKLLLSLCFSVAELLH